MMKSQRGDTENINLIEEGKKISIDKIIKMVLKSQIQSNAISLSKVKK